MDYSQIFTLVLKKRVLKHALFWLFNIGIISVPLYFYEGTKAIDHLLPRLIVIYVYIIISVYINLYFLIPVYLTPKKYLLFTVFQIGNIGLFSFLKIFTKLAIINDEIDENIFEEISTAITIIIIYMVFTTTVKYFFQFLTERISYHQVLAELGEMEKEKLEIELNALKAQLNPHFMFNTLNNIYALSLDKSDKAPELILKLSDLMSYTLYECKERFVVLSKEKEFIENYLELEKIRVTDKVKISFNVSGSLENLQISPLLLLTYIENAFKHGVNKRPENPFINIELSTISNSKLYFKVENNKEEAVNVSENEGIGLKNAEKRLNLLYPDSHKLTISDNKTSFVVELELNLNTE